ncbi:MULTISPECIES: type IV pilus biogenesis protein PilP [Pectobacterium]|uniref:type IV pilus biogenesis protein PilP n=1 Tax=Pectobacterium TaxID=122277 RepID=UPI000F6463CC|nr:MULTISPECIES: type IV pilus biogenesis protein PilP [Pectobacterium]AZK61318.1 type IV pilus biogenesis protein PilP [Pectobacterium versatile]MBE5222131.1 type IV pilus biogenesis protein PilP [Pectobacterium quasiaquaticum]MCH5049187.1 type IV pilus biogenesis protein PilP [Pectobacterium aquaticum]
MMKVFSLFPLLFTASVLASDMTEISPVPSGDVLVSDEVTVRTLRAVELEIDLIKTQQARQDAQNALAESRLKGQTLKNRPDMLLPSATPGVGLGTASKGAGVSLAITTARLKEIWSENRTLRAAAEFNGRRIVLQPGDIWPGSEHRVKSITSRGVELSNGQMIQTGVAQ